jgi:hypothetical protein
LSGEEESLEEIIYKTILKVNDLSVLTTEEKIFLMVNV